MRALPSDKIRFVGNVMIDTLARLLPQARQRTLGGALGLTAGTYTLVTLHRPANVDDLADLAGIADGLRALASDTPVVFPVHPRTRRRLGAAIGTSPPPHLKLLEPLGYLDFLSLLCEAGVVITDSGGIQEETTWLGVPCLTVRPNTERPITIEIGTNELVEPTAAAIEGAARRRLRRRPAAPRDVPPLWDGRTAARVVEAILDASPLRPPSAGGRRAHQYVMRL